MKTISIKQPWAHLICAGIKDIENRTWPTKFRGRVLIHASAKKNASPFDLLTDEQYDSISQENRIIANNSLEYGAIIGSVEIVDCVINHESIWAKKSLIPKVKKLIEKGEEPIYNWVIVNPIMFPEPIPAKGSLNFWDYPNILSEQEEKDGELFCHCQLPVKLENQVMSIGDGTHLCRYCGGKWYR